jgi:hypothetical protein
MWEDKHTELKGMLLELCLLSNYWNIPIPPEAAETEPLLFIQPTYYEHIRLPLIPAEP